MEELKAMVKAILDSLIEMTTRAYKAEQEAETLKLNVIRFQNDVTYWKEQYFKLERKYSKEIYEDVKAKKEAANDTNGT